MKYALNILLLFSLFQSSAQNLVPNPSFESKLQCPMSGSLLNGYVASWTKYCSPSYTPDYYHSCSPDTLFGVPQSIMLYQEEFRGCDAYVGLITRGLTLNDREIVGATLSNPLVIGEKYFISFRTVRGGTKWDTTYWEYAANNIGLRFSTIQYSESSPTLIDNWAHLYSSSIITDTLNWITISGSITADSNYNYIMLGNFFDDANTDTLSEPCNGCIYSHSYYLIDDICVSTDSLYCNGGIDNEPCLVGINELSKPDKKLIRIVDTMGRETEDKPNTLLIYIYSDGTTEKVYRVK